MPQVSISATRVDSPSGLPMAVILFCKLGKGAYNFLKYIFKMFHDPPETDSWPTGGFWPRVWETAPKDRDSAPECKDSGFKFLAQPFLKSNLCGCSEAEPGQTEGPPASDTLLPKGPARCPGKSGGSNFWKDGEQASWFCGTILSSWREHSLSSVLLLHPLGTFDELKNP